MSTVEGSRTSVAIVDDEPDLQKLYKLAIASRGYRISYVASDGTDAIEKQESTPCKPCIIVMDHRMPTKNGVETTKEILKQYPHTKIIFVSADEAIEKDAMAAGASRFLKKPISLRDLLKNIDDEAAACSTDGKSS